jgi:hypothetical protein
MNEPSAGCLTGKNRRFIDLMAEPPSHETNVGLVCALTVVYTSLLVHEGLLSSPPHPASYGFLARSFDRFVEITTP